MLDYTGITLALASAFPDWTPFARSHAFAYKWITLTSPLYYWLASRDSSAYRRRQTGAPLPPSAAR